MYSIESNGMILCEEEDPKKTDVLDVLDLDGASSICDVNQYLECLLLN